MFLNSTFVILLHVLFHRDDVPPARNNTVYAVPVPWLQKPVWQEVRLNQWWREPACSHFSDVQENLITAEVWQGSLKGGNCIDVRGEEQHERGRLLLATFLWSKWGCNRSSWPVRKKMKSKESSHTTTAFAKQLSTFLVPEIACNLS